MPNLGKIINPLSPVQGKIERQVHKGLGIEHIPTPTDLHKSVFDPEKPASQSRPKKKAVTPQSPDFQVAGRGGRSR